MNTCNNCGAVGRADRPCAYCGMGGDCITAATPVVPAKRAAAKSAIDEVIGQVQEIGAGVLLAFVLAPIVLAIWTVLIWLLLSVVVVVPAAFVSIIQDFVGGPHGWSVMGVEVATRDARWVVAALCALTCGVVYLWKTRRDPWT